MPPPRQPGERPTPRLWAAVLVVAAVALVGLVILAGYWLARRPGEEPPPTTSLRIAFWNLRDLSERSRDERERRAICEVLQEFDAVAVAEVQDQRILGELATILEGLSGDWRSVTSDRVGNSPSAAEHFGILYRSDRLGLRAAWQLPELVLRGPDFSDIEGFGKHAFDREPFAAALATRDGRFDFALVVAHVTYGERVAPRIAEVRALGRYYEDVFREEQDVLVAGDFNRNAGDAQSLGWLRDRHGLVDTTTRDVPTVVRGRNTFDHILLNPDYTTEFTGRAGVVPFDETMFGGDPRAAELVVSDHRPVWIELAVPARDDD